MTLSGASSATTTADSSGNYSFSGLVNGSVTPSKIGFIFNPFAKRDSNRSEFYRDSFKFQYLWERLDPSRE